MFRLNDDTMRLDRQPKEQIIVSGHRKEFNNRRHHSDDKELETGLTKPAASQTSHDDVIPEWTRPGDLNSLT